MKVTNALGNSSESAYDAAGRLVWQTDFMGNKTETTYDAAGRALKITAPFDGTDMAQTKQYYDANGNLTTRRTLTKTDRNGTVLSYTYNADGKVLSITTQSAADGIDAVQEGKRMFRKRVLSWIIDYVVVMIPFFVICVIMALVQEIAIQSQYEKVFYVLLLLVLLLCAVGLYCRDMLCGRRSFGKKCVHLRIIGKSGGKPNYLQLLARDIFLVIWPVEVLLVLLGKERLGDRLAGTLVVEED